MDLKLWDDISNMRWLQKLLLWCLLLSISTTEVKNNRSLGPHIMENQPRTFSPKMVQKLLCALSAARFLKMYETCSELRSWYYGVCLYAQVVPKARNNSFLWHCIMADGLHKKGKKYEANFAWNRPKWTSSCEMISQTCGDSRSCYFGVCFYPTVLPKWKITGL